jgi:hypothetical protein
MLKAEDFSASSNWELKEVEEDDIDRDIEPEDQMAEEAHEREEEEPEEEEEKEEHRTDAEKEYGQGWEPLRWLEKESESMTRYLDALPSGLYQKGEGGWLVATDGSSESQENSGHKVSRVDGIWGSMAA